MEARSRLRPRNNCWEPCSPAEGVKLAADKRLRQERSFWSRFGSAFSGGWNVPERSNHCTVREACELLPPLLQPRSPELPAGVLTQTP